MKCDELKYEKLGDMMPFYPRSTIVIRKQFVDAAIAEQKRALWLARADRAKTEYNHWILIWHCELNNHLFFINKTRYKNRAKVDRLHYPWEWRDIWDEVERKCRAKAEEYK